MSNFIEDFLSYNIGTECPKEYLRWAALSAIGVAAGFRYSLQQGRVKITPHHYTIFIDKAGTRKTYAIDQVRELIRESFPDHPVGSSVMSRDGIIDFLHKECERAYTNEDGITGVIYHPMSFFINEFKHFTSYNINTMISFFVDIFDRPMFDCRTIKRDIEYIEKPCINFLAAENSDWIIFHIKQGLMTGGFSRRFIPIFEPRDDQEKIIPEPFLPDNHKELWTSMKLQLKQIHEGHAKYTWEADARKLFHEWYHEHKKSMPDDEVVRSFMRSKDQMLLKIIICLDLAESRPGYKVTVELLEIAFALFSLIEVNMSRLYAASGRNELALAQQEVVEILKANKGILPERVFLRLTDKNMNPIEKFSVLKNLNQLGFIVRVKAPKGEWGPEGTYFMNVERFAKEKANGGNFTILNPV